MSTEAPDSTAVDAAATSSKSILSVTDLSVSYGSGDRLRQVTHDVSFNIAPGEVVALVGESGSGKSVTALSTVGLLGESAQLAGSVRYESLTRMPIKPAMASVGSFGNSMVDAHMSRLLDTTIRGSPNACQASLT